MNMAAGVIERPRRRRDDDDDSDPEEQEISFANMFGVAAITMGRTIRGAMVMEMTIRGVRTMTYLVILTRCIQLRLGCLTTMHQGFVVPLELLRMFRLH